jgi:hypothetical protein
LTPIRGLLLRAPKYLHATLRGKILARVENIRREARLMTGIGADCVEQSYIKFLVQARLTYDIPTPALPNKTFSRLKAPVEEGYKLRMKITENLTDHGL